MKRPFELFNGAPVINNSGALRMPYNISIKIVGLYAIVFTPFTGDNKILVIVLIKLDAIR